MPKIVNHEEYREKLIKKCIELFSRQGISNSPMREIAKELGVSTGLLYHYFPTKESILEHMFENIRTVDVKKVLSKVDDSMKLDEKMEIYNKHCVNNKNDYQNVLLMAIDFFRSTKEETTKDLMGKYSDFYSSIIENNLQIKKPLGSFIFIFLIGLFYHDLLRPDDDFFNEQSGILKKAIQLLSKE